MEVVTQYLEKIEKQLATIDFPASPENLYKPLQYFLNIGGKRIRPILTLMGAELFGEIDQKALDVAVGIELFHNFTLLHDDIMDHAPLRRGFQTVHEKWDTSTAILSGDTLFVQAMDYILNGESSLLNRLFLQTAREVCEGQQMDMDFESRAQVSIDEYIEMIRLKTSVLIGCALQSGAILAGASQENQKRLYDFGVNIGLAFQLQDDHLDSFGESAQVGKTIGGDIVGNKKTFLYLKALEIASETQKKQLEVLATETDATLKIAQVKELYQALAIPTHSLHKIEEYFQKGMAELAAIDLPATKKEPLKELVNYLYHRNF